MNTNIRVRQCVDTRITLHSLRVSISNVHQSISKSPLRRMRQYLPHMKILHLVLFSDQ